MPGFIYSLIPTSHWHFKIKYFSEDGCLNIIVEDKNATEEVAVTDVTPTEQIPSSSVTVPSELNKIQELKEPVNIGKVKDPSPIRDIPIVDVEDIKTREIDTDVEMTEVVQLDEKIEKTEPKINTQSLNGDVIKVNHRIMAKFYSKTYFLSPAVV